jgi:hypothetical protein
VAAVELDKFCDAKFWTRTILAEVPTNGEKLKRGLIVYEGMLRAARLFRTMHKLLTICRLQPYRNSPAPNSKKTPQAQGLDIR